MNSAKRRSVIGRWLRWALACPLCLVWMIAALLGWLLGGAGNMATRAAKFTLNLIEDLLS